MVATFAVQFIPTFDQWAIWRFMVPSINLFGREVRGEGMRPIMAQIAGTPITFLAPFMRQVVDKVGGPRIMHIIYRGWLMIHGVARYFTGYSSLGRVGLLTLYDTISETMRPLDDYAGHVLSFEMFDYVEYKTGVRSEGITLAFQGVIGDIVKGNIYSLTSDPFQAWMGVHYIDGTVPDPEIPERFARWAWPMACLAGVIQGFCYLIARIAFPYKKGQNVPIELELKQRREAAEQLEKELEEELETV